MTIDEPTRRSLYASLATALGDDQADTLMSMLLPYPVTELATRDDVTALAVSLRGEMAAGFARTDLQFAELRGEMHERFAKVDERLAGCGLRVAQ